MAARWFTDEASGWAAPEQIPRPLASRRLSEEVQHPGASASVFKPQASCIVIFLQNIRRIIEITPYEHSVISYSLCGCGSWRYKRRADGQHHQTSEAVMRIYPGDRAPRASRVGHNNGCRKNRSIRVLRPLRLMSSARISLILRMR